MLALRTVSNRGTIRVSYNIVVIPRSNGKEDGKEVNRYKLISTLPRVRGISQRLKYSRSLP